MLFLPKGGLPPKKNKMGYARGHGPSGHWLRARASVVNTNTDGMSRWRHLFNVAKINFKATQPGGRNTAPSGLPAYSLLIAADPSNPSTPCSLFGITISALPTPQPNPTSLAMTITLNPAPGFTDGAAIGSIGGPSGMETGASGGPLTTSLTLYLGWTTKPAPGTYPITIQAGYGDVSFTGNTLTADDIATFGLILTVTGYEPGGITPFEAWFYQSATYVGIVLAGLYEGGIQLMQTLIGCSSVEAYEVMVSTTLAQMNQPTPIAPPITTVKAAASAGGGPATAGTATLAVVHRS